MNGPSVPESEQNRGALHSRNENSGILSSKVHRRFEVDSAQNQLVAVGLALVDLADCVQLD